MEEASVIEEENSVYSSASAIWAVALPACVLNAAPQVTSVIQTGLLGKYVGTTALGAFGAVTITAGFASRVFNFLVDGSSAQIGKTVGERGWDRLGSRVATALSFAVGAGALASAALAVIINPVSVHVLHLAPEVQAEAHVYWRIRVALVPVLLLNMALSGTLQGFRRVRVSAAINSGQAVLEMAGSAAVLAYGVRVGTLHGLAAMGCVTLITQLLALVAGLLCILTLPPVEAAGEFSLLEAWFGRGGAVAADAPGGGLRAPLLGGGALVQHDSVASFRGFHGPGGGKPAGSSDDDDMSDDMFSATSSFASVASSAGSSLGVSLGGGIGLLGGSGRATGREPVLRAAGCPGAPAAANGAPAAHVNGAAPSGERSSSDGVLDFVRDGLNMLVRSMILQVSFFCSLVAASHLGTASLAAHAVVSQLWNLISYAVDGFAAAGIVLGSRLAAQARDPRRAASAKLHLLRLIKRTLGAGLMAGMASGAAFAVWRVDVIAAFTSDPTTIAALRDGTWAVLCLAQPINGLVFVFDGLMYASQNFRFIRNYMLLGFAFVFCPVMALQALLVQKLWFVWLAAAVINIWRAGGAAYLIFFIFFHDFDAQLADGEAEGAV